MKKNIIPDGAGYWSVKPNKRAVAYTLVNRDGLFTGHADCSPTDSFDPVFGQRLSKLRAILKYRQYRVELLVADIELAKMMDPRNFEIVRKALIEKLEEARVSVRKIKETIKSVTENTPESPNMCTGEHESASK